MTIGDIYVACGGQVPVWMSALIQYFEQEDTSIMTVQQQLVGVVGNIRNTINLSDAATLAAANAYTDAAVSGASNGLLDMGTF